MVVGDPSLAVNRLRDMKEKEPGKYRQYGFEIKKNLHEPGFLGKFFNFIREQTGFLGKNPLDTLVTEMSRKPDLQENFDALAKGFDHDGYKVERVPFLGLSNAGDVPWITYNNSVFDGDNVFVPNFGIPELDDLGNGVYEKYGYTPVPMEMTQISSKKGAINCITKVIEREYA
jgi:hypothetical protein